MPRRLGHIRAQNLAGIGTRRALVHARQVLVARAVRHLLARVVPHLRMQGLELLDLAVGEEHRVGSGAGFLFLASALG